MPTKSISGKWRKPLFKMVTESINSFCKKRILKAAAAVVKYDDVVDDLFLKIKTELPAMMEKDSKNAEYYIDLIMIAKYF